MRKTVFILTVLLLLIGCSTSKLRTYVDPSIQSTSINSTAIFPIRNVRLLPDESRQINRNISQKFLQKNPNVKIIGPAESIDLINQSGLADKYSEFLRSFMLSGIPNTVTLKEIGNALNVDSILQGELFDIYQYNGQFGVDLNSYTSLTIHYILLSTQRGNILWEATTNARKNTATVFQPAPPLYEVILIANDKIFTALPQLGK